MRSRNSRWEIFGFEVAVSVCLSVVVYTAPGWGESLDRLPADAPAHRWSNDEHIGETVTSDGCGVKVAPGYRAEYKPGVDSRGRAVAPAQSTEDWRITSLDVSVGGGDAETSDGDDNRRHKGRRSHGVDDADSARPNVQAFATLEQGKDQDCSSSFK